MSEYGHSACNYSMLTEHLLVLFKCYILGGRVRAPPEYELHDLIPTFRPEAKTNRRALQSKFKSWARRMEVRNDKLVLSSNGKLIVSKEKSKDLILSLHLKGHLPVEQVITQIRRTYTWTSKNFGMDREVVTVCIFKHCPSTECRVELRKNFTNRNRVLFPGVMIPPFTHPIIPSTSGPNPSMFFPWVPGPNPLYPSMRPTELVRPPKWMPHQLQNVERHTVLAPRMDVKKEEVGFVDHDSSRETSRQCKKVRNIHEFKSVLEASYANPDHYPAVLSNPKTQFFGLLDLVPKKVCASSAICRFRKELNKRPEHRFNKLKKQRAEIFCRKVLRDRNKMAKTKPFSQEKRSKKGKNKGKRFSTFMAPPKKIKREDAIKQEPEMNERRMSLRIHKKGPELIDIASSEEDEKPIFKGPETPPNGTSVLSTKRVTKETAFRPVLQRLQMDHSAIGVRMLKPVSGIRTARPISSAPAPLVIRPRSIQPKIQVPTRSGNFRLILAKRMPDGRYVVVNSQAVAKSPVAQPTPPRPSLVQSLVSEVKPVKDILVSNVNPIDTDVLVGNVNPIRTEVVPVEKQAKGPVVSKKDVKSDVSFEMERFLGWIRKTKTLIKPSLHTGSEKAMQMLTSYLNTGLYYVRDTRKGVLQIENSHKDKGDKSHKMIPMKIESINDES